MVIQLLEPLIFTAIDLALSVLLLGSWHGYANQIAGIVVRRIGADTVVVAIVFRWAAVTSAPRIGKQGALVLQISGIQNKV